MKVILSRKGFDSQYGGMPSPLLPDGRLIPLPIPSTHDHTRLEMLDQLQDPAMDQLLCDLSGGRYGLHTQVHLDPDLGGKHTVDLAGWRPALGQTGAAQSHHARHNIGKEDVFLFFGWFRLVEYVEEKWRFAPKSPDIHVIFGWLEVDEVMPVVTRRDETLRRYPWLAPHPHVASPDWYTDGRNTIYISRSRSIFAQEQTRGGGYFPKFTQELQLTCHGRSRSIWSLPAWFMPRGRPALSYHASADRWEVCGSEVILRSVAKGQEFVIDGALYPELEVWTKTLIQNHA